MHSKNDLIVDVLNIDDTVKILFNTKGPELVSVRRVGDITLESVKLTAQQKKKKKNGTEWTPTVLKWSLTELI